MIALVGGTPIITSSLQTVELLITHMMKNLTHLAGSPRMSLKKKKKKKMYHSLGCKVEDGASLYSVVLLGHRPKIMETLSLAPHANGVASLEDLLAGLNNV